MLPQTFVQTKEKVWLPRHLQKKAALNAMHGSQTDPNQQPQLILSTGVHFQSGGHTTNTRQLILRRYCERIWVMPDGSEPTETSIQECSVDQLATRVQGQTRF